MEPMCTWQYYLFCNIGISFVHFEICVKAILEIWVPAILEHLSFFYTYLSVILDDLLADGALPQALVAVQLEVGLQVESLDVSTVLAPRGQRYPLVGQGTP